MAADYSVNRLGHATVLAEAAARPLAGPEPFAALLAPATGQRCPHDLRPHGIALEGALAQLTVARDQMKGTR